ncbi:hypothetical protein NQ318_019484 [Aromia moschata]|uniref:Uncharacterized protein n=1 Tax=Aromia moschata TaxID=1265417 RepID=A0AAV8X9S8_9CUCU|nr:hypothetical protein NQ318_019484 [Aromia moschata]
MDHPCIEGYGHIYIDNNHYFDPVLEVGKTVIRWSQLDDYMEGVVEDELKTNENICPNKNWLVSIVTGQ